MPRTKIRVRNIETGAIAEIAEEALAHFPGFERIDSAAPEAVLVEPRLPPPAPVEPTTPKPSRRVPPADNEEE